ITTAGMAAASPNAVASSASAMPGATTARLVVCDFEIPMKLFMMPQTVPNRPTKGAVAPMVARTPVPRRMRRPQAGALRSSPAATRVRDEGREAVTWGPLGAAGGGLALVRHGRPRHGDPGNRDHATRNSPTPVPKPHTDWPFDHARPHDDVTMLHCQVQGYIGN